MNIDEFFIEQDRKDYEGKLTVGEAVINSYYRLLEGTHAGKVIIKTCAKINNEPIVFFANGLTWTSVESLKNIRCERIYPAFNEVGRHTVDHSLATWYPDNSSTPQHHQW